MNEIPTGLTNVPRHVAIIMDGNGRWAKHNRKPRLWGHTKGVETVREIIKASGDAGVEVLTLFAFSEENWERPKVEVDGIMALIDRYIVRERSELNRNGVRMRAIGDLSRLPSKTRRLIGETEERLSNNKGLLLQIALSYGGRSELTRACRVIAQKVQDGLLDPSEIDQGTIDRHLYTQGCPDPDLLIRTSGEERISNFLLWQIAYSELHFTETYWPAFSRQEYLGILSNYQNRERRFGLTGEQIAGRDLVAAKSGTIAKVVALVRGETTC